MGLQDEETPIDRDIANAMIASTPEVWKSAILTLNRIPGSVGIGEFTHSISSPEGHPPVTPDDSLYEATYRLDKLFKKYGTAISKAIYRIEREVDNSWKYVVNFEHVKTKP